MKIGKKGLIIIGVASVLAIVGGVLVYLNYKKSGEGDVEEIDETLLPDETVTGGGAYVAPVTVNPLGDNAAVQKFQDWLDVKHPNWLDNGKSLNKGNGYGNFGSQTAKAWNKYGAEYKNIAGVVLSGATSGGSAATKIKATDTDTSEKLQLGMKGKRVAAMQFMLNYVYGTAILIDGRYGDTTRKALVRVFKYALGNSIDNDDLNSLRIKAVAKAGSIANLTAKMSTDVNYVKAVKLFS